MANNHIAILMGTYQGENFICQQFASILTQTHQAWSLWVSDDGSNDHTLALLARFQRDSPRPVQVIEGPKNGFSRNFLSLLCNPQIQADFFCFADQDDIWYPDRLERALNWLCSQPESIPALYCSRTRLVNERGEHIGYSPLFGRTPGFANALVQNIGGGNTMVMNRAAREVLLQAGADVNVVSHDWWVYIVVAAVDGNICYDPNPTLDYRQHGQNLIGANQGWRPRFARLQLLLQGRFSDWNCRHLQALPRIEQHIPAHNRQTLRHFSSLRKTGLLLRLWNFKKSRLYRQSTLGNLALFMAVLMKRV
jgi:glycosyltransferase involved in cell wall biosynthesis